MPPVWSANVLWRLIEHCVFPLALHLYPPSRRSFSKTAKGAVLLRDTRTLFAMILFPINIITCIAISRCVLVELVTRVLL